MVCKFSKKLESNLYFKSLLSAFIKTEFGGSKNNAGKRLELWWNADAELAFRSTAKVNFNAGTQASGWDNLLTRNNGEFIKPGQKWGSISFTGPQGGNLTYFLSAGYETDGLRDLNTSLTAGLGFYVSDNLTLGSNATIKNFKEWLIWDSEIERLTNYEADLKTLNLSADWNPSDDHELRVKFQWASVDAILSEVYEISSNGRLEASASLAGNFSFADTALQIRYRYRIGPLSDAYLVYSRGGYYGSESGNEGSGNLFEYGWDNVQVESLIFKVRLAF